MRGAFADRPFSWQSEKSMVLGVKRQVIPASSCRRIFRELLAFGRFTSNLFGGNSLTLRRYRFDAAILWDRGGRRGGTRRSLRRFGLCALQLVDLRLHLAHLRLHLLIRFS